MTVSLPKTLTDSNDKSRDTGSQEVEFLLSRHLPDGSLVYTTPHEIWNTIDLTFPPDYWSPGNAQYPPRVVMPSFRLQFTEYRKQPTDQVIAELTRRLPNLHFGTEFPGFLACYVPKKGLVAMGDLDGYRLQCQTEDDDGGGDVVDVDLDTYEQDVNKICTRLIHALTKTKWADDIFGLINPSKAVQ